jgi:signal transduction histidine kinase
MKNNTQLTLVFTALFTSAFVFLYLLLITDINRFLHDQGLEHSIGLFNVNYIFLFLLTVLITYGISALMVDRILNPIRLMTAKLREIGKRDFSKPLIIQSRDDELREYVNAFNDMSQNLCGYIERQKRFISDVSHELTTPITIVNGHANRLIRRWREQPELLDNGLQVIRTEILRMNELTDSLLMLAKSDSGKQEYRFAGQGINALVRECISETGLIAPNAVIEAELEPGAKVFCDADALRRVLRIVLNNALKYTQEEKRITIKTQSSHGLTTVTIKDNGIGIPAEHLPRIFERFYRVDASRTSKTGSSGLGLAIAREIIDAHGGEIKVESVAGEGTEVGFFIKPS